MSEQETVVPNPVVSVVPPNLTSSFTPDQLMDPAFDSVDKVGLEVDAALIDMVTKMVRSEEDQGQVALVDSIQQYRALLIKFATLAYMRKPSSAMLLTAITSLVGAVEKAVRDDRKEQAKKEENETSAFSFNQIVESLNAIAKGAVITPTFELTNFILDPTKSLIEIGDGFKPIKETELTQGNALVDLDGNPI